MNKRKKLWLAGMITGILTLQSAFCAFAENIGPAFDPKLNGGVSTEQSAVLPVPLHQQLRTALLLIQEIRSIQTH